MITNAPLLEWGNLWRALTRRVPSVEAAELAEPWCKSEDVAGWLSRSAWSLALVVIWRKRLTAGVPTIWIPDFFCNSSLLAIRATGARLVFYPVDLQMQPDMPACRQLAEANVPDIFLLVHYFGRPAVDAPSREFCIGHGAWLVEDAAHVLRPSGSVGTGGDFVMYSPHKNIAIPDGAVLVARPNGPSLLGSETVSSFGNPACWAEQLVGLTKEMGSSITSCQRHANIWLIKRILQKLGFGGVRKSSVPFLESRESSLPDPMIGPAPSRVARRLLAAQIHDLGRIARLRQRRQLLWDHLFDKAVAESDEILAAERPIARSWTPYLASYECNALQAPKIYDACRDRGLPALTWPDLAPEVMAQPDKHLRALHLRHSRLYLPVHQSLSVTDIATLAYFVRQAEKLEMNFELIWDNATKTDWSNWLGNAGRSNLLQSWAYGDAKKDESGWKVRRGVFYKGQEVIAVVQVLQKSLLGVLRISRVNRGPLFLKVGNVGDMRGVVRALGGLGNIRRGKLLSIAPELYLSGLNLSALEEMHFRQSSPNAWESIWVDLNPDISELRKKLAGKWRTALASAEKSGLTCENGTDDYLFDWMMARYQELMQQKGFVGSPVKLLLALRKHQAKGEQPVVLRACFEGVPIAGVCIVPHGTCATYLVGWSGPEGRHLKATQYLLWRAIAYLKGAGFSWFDLGGVDEERTSGIAAFKSGVNGSRYETVGEYWKW